MYMWSAAPSIPPHELTPLEYRGLDHGVLDNGGTLLIFMEGKLPQKQLATQESLGQECLNVHFCLSLHSTVRQQTQAKNGQIH